MTKTKIAPAKRTGRDTFKIIFSTEDRLNRRGVKARASVFGFTWVKVDGRDHAHYVSAGVPQRMIEQRGTATPRMDPKQPGAAAAFIVSIAKGISPTAPYRFHACPSCGYADADGIGDVAKLCGACVADIVALEALALSDATGIKFGYRFPPIAERGGFIEAGGFGWDRRLNRLR